MLFEVTPDDISQLNDVDACHLVAELCEQEVRSQGHSTSAVTRGGHPNACDGGIDVRVSLPPGPWIPSYIPTPETGFQVKTQDMPRRAILREMAPRGVLRKSIVELSTAGGAYILVSSRSSVSDTALNARKKAMQEALATRIPPTSLRVEFYDQTRLATWVNRYRGLVLWVHRRIGRPTYGWHPYADWSSSPAPLDTPYLLDNAVRLIGPTAIDLTAAEGTNTSRGPMAAKGINTPRGLTAAKAINTPRRLTATEGIHTLRHILANPKGIVRLVGLSGVGKTRLIQALFDSRIGTDPLPPACAIYTDLSDNPNPSPLDLTSHLLDSQSETILIIDNCGPTLHRKLSARITAATGRLSLITVEYDMTDDEPEHTHVFKLEAASVELIEKILENRRPELHPASRRVIAQLSGGNARMTFALATTARNGESLATLRDRDLLERLLHQGKDKNPDLLNAAKACALLYSFDGETLTARPSDEPTNNPSEPPTPSDPTTPSELSILARLAGMTPDRLYAHIAELCRRQLVQKRGKWRALLPQALAHQLAQWALEDIPLQTIEAAILQHPTPRTVRSFTRRMGCLSDSEPAQKLLRKWLAEEGPLEFIGLYDELAQTCFANMAPIDPETTLSFIEKSAPVLTCPRPDPFRNIPAIARVLRSIAYDPELFDRAATLLKRLAIVHPGTEADSPKSLFTSLFTLSFSGTHASPAQRAQMVKSLLASPVEPENALGLESLQTLLKCSQFFPPYPCDFGAHSRDYGWSPQTPEDRKTWFEQALNIVKAFAQPGTRSAAQVRQIFADRFSELCIHSNLLPQLIALSDQLAEHAPWPEGWISVRQTLRKCQDHLPKPDLKRLRALAARLRPNTLEKRIRVYALSQGSCAWEGTLNAMRRVDEICLQLGRQLARDKDTLETLLPDLFTAQPGEVIALGRGLASACESLKPTWSHLADRFLHTPRIPPDPHFLGGFLEAAMQRDPAECEALLDTVLADPRWHGQFIYLQVCTGHIDAAHVCAGIRTTGIDRLLSAVQHPTIPTRTFQFLTREALDDLINDPRYCDFLRQLANRAEGWGMAITLLEMCIFNAQRDHQPITPEFKALGRELLAHAHRKSGTRADHLTQLARLTEVSLNAPRDHPLARRLCAWIAERVMSYSMRSANAYDLVRALAHVCPRAVLDELVEKFEGRLVLMQLVRDHHLDPLGGIPPDILLAWAQKNPPTRFTALAYVIGFSISKSYATEHWSPIAEKLIAQAPDPAPVLDIFLTRFHPKNPVLGSTAEKLASRTDLIQVLAEHDRPAVVEWSHRVRPDYETRVARERENEAAHDWGFE